MSRRTRRGGSRRISPSCANECRPRSPTPLALADDAPRAFRRRCSSAIGVRVLRTARSAGTERHDSAGMRPFTAEVVLVTVTTLSGPAMTAAAPGRTCARRLRGAAAKAPASSQGRLSGLSASGRCHVSTRLDRRPFARRFAAALRDSAQFAAPGLGRGRWRWALSTRRFPERGVRD